MFFQFADDVTTVDVPDIDTHYIISGYVTQSEFDRISSALNVSDALTAELFNARIALYVKKNFFLVVGIDDEDCFVRDCLLNSVNRYASINVNLGKIIFAFFEGVLKRYSAQLAESEEKINYLEELVLTDKADGSFNYVLLGLKKELLAFKNLYSQLIEIVEMLIDNENEIFDYDDLKYLRNLLEKTKRQQANTDTMRNSINHLQEAYSSYLDLKLNQTMKIFTALTTVFFPLTLIVGWYGMNFTSMPEFAWRYGYLYVIILSVIVVAGLVVIIKKRKWL